MDDSTKASILANMTTITTRTDPKTNYTAATTGIIFTAEDDDGISYYFAGAPTDNWVKFAGFYWRIIRINGDGTIRLIYNGTTTAATAEGTRIGTSRFNNNIGFHSVGFMWKSNTLHGLTNNSGVKASLDAWYVDNLSNYASYIDNDAGFCGDRTVEVDENNNYDYGPGIRKWSTDEYTLKCPDSSDLYTLSGSTKGNKALTYPIGLITSDEVAYAGGSGANGTNTSYYLYTGNYYWTISPSSYYNDNAFVFCVHADYGTLHSSSDVSIYKDVRPVINLRADVTLSGSGTSGDPYTVS